MTSRSVHISIGLAAIVLVCQSAFGAGGPVPQLPWMHEGLLITSTWVTLIVPGTAKDFQEDENGKWVSRVVRQKNDGTGRSGTSASGLSQLLITCLDGDKAFIAANGFSNSQVLGFAAPVPLAGATGVQVSATDADSYWKDPAKLLAMHSDPEHGISVTRGPWANGGKTHDAVRVTIVSLGYTTAVYDAQTGGCLHSASASLDPNGIGDTTLTQTDFVSMRDLSIPWAKDAIPDSVLATKALHYRGGKSVIGSPIPIPGFFTMDMTVAAHGQGWMQMAIAMDAQVPGAPAFPPTHSQMIYGRASLMGLWADPTALSKLKQGQVLDEDPLTKMRTLVSQITPSTVIIESSNTSGEFQNGYDRKTGLLVESRFTDGVARQITTMQLIGRQ